MKYAAVTIAIALSLAIAFLLCYTPYEKKVTVRHTFYIQEDFDTVRKVMVRTNCLEEMVEVSNGTLVNRKWDKIQVGGNRLLDLDWFVEAKGYFTIVLDGNYVKGQHIKLKQSAFIEKDKMNTVTELLEPAGVLTGYRSEAKIYRSSGITRVDSTVTVEATHKILHTPRIKKYMDDQVRTGAQGSALSFEEGIKKVINKYKGRNFFFDVKPKQDAA